MIEVAKEGDIVDIVPLLVQMHGTSPTPLPPIAPHKLLGALKDSLDGGRMFVARRGRVVGILALTEGTHWYSDEKFLGDLVFYVAPCSRTSRIASHLLRAATEYATMRGLPLMMAVVHGEDVQRKDNFYARHGFIRVGGVYSRGL
jgi:GNAT superfamily N-acetyltransferase